MVDDPTQAVSDREGEFNSPGLPGRKLLGELWSLRRHILFAAGLGLCLFLCLGLVRKKKYTAKVTLMPPEAASLSTTSSLSLLNGGSLGLGLNGGGALLTSRTPASTVIGILNSRAVQQPIVDQFHLLGLFHTKLPGGARDRLWGATSADEDKKTGLVAISVTLADPVLARDIANAYVTELNAALTNVNTSSAHRERVFLEQRIVSLKAEIDNLAMQLSQFSKKTGTINPQLQGQTIYQSLARVQLEIGEAEAELSALKSTYGEDNVRVRAAVARVASLHAQLSALGGSSKSDVKAEATVNDAVPSLRQLPDLGVTFTNLSEQLSLEQSVYATLSRQYELSKVEEAKEIPAVRVLDAAEIPEKPSSIPAWQLALLGGVGFGLAACACSTLLVLWRLSGAGADEQNETRTHSAP